MTKLEAAAVLCGFYEAELLTSLMLKYWGHPAAQDADLCNHLVETAAEVLNRSRDGEQFFQDIPPDDMNFVAAVWYAEWSNLSDSQDPQTEQRREWLAKVRHSLPSCFCDPDNLM